LLTLPKQNGAKAFNEYVDLYGRSGERRDLLQKMIAASKNVGSSEPLTDEEIIVEMTNLIFAGTDTTGNTFSYLFWEMAKHPEWQGHLQEELKTVTWTKVVPEYRMISKLPVLEALIQEALRLWPASPASLPRISGVQGGVVDGVTVPPNVSLLLPSMRFKIFGLQFDIEFVLDYLVVPGSYHATRPSCLP
jgi:cytochrome P450